MSIFQDLLERSDKQCELCGSTKDLSVYTLAPAFQESIDDSIVCCAHCRSQIEGEKDMDVNHWRCLNDSMWSSVMAVQVMAWRLLNRLKTEDWSRDLLDMMYLDEETLKWAEADGDGQQDDIPKHKDSNGNVLENGDTVHLIKNLDVKGTSLTAKRGTAVRRIKLVDGNPEQIEGKVEGQQIVILTKFVRKTN
ncbi:MAG: PhnA protein [Bacteroidetes bacterium 4572_77]|nr:MAG: PhnA protein [Bacteroidetes bacterium 4572_77]